MTVCKSTDQLQSALAPFRKMAIFEGCELSLPESPGRDGDTPLHAAAMDEQPYLLVNLLPFVTDINVPGDIGNTPLHCAVSFNRPEIARLLLSHGADIHRVNDYGDAPIDWMQDHPGFVDIVRKYGCQ